VVAQNPKSILVRPELFAILLSYPPVTVFATFFVPTCRSLSIKQFRHNIVVIFGVYL